MKIANWWSKLTLAVLIVGAWLLSSCSEKPSTSPSADKSSKKSYGSLNVVTDWGAGHLDPQLASGQGFSNAGAAIFDTLTRYDHQTDAVSPEIAERWEISPDGMAHTFYIRKGVKFQDGSDLTGVDVKYSIERHIGPETVHLNAPTWRAAIDKVELTDDYTVVLRMKTPQYELLVNDGTGGTAAIVPKKYIEERGVEEFRKTLMGSGPYKLVKYEAGSRLELEANESHWRQVPQFKNIAVLYVKEEATKIAMLKTGELDIVEVAPDSVAGLKAAGVRVLKGEPTMVYYGVIFFDVENPGKYPFGDVRVRKALQLAINQKEIGQTIFSGDGQPFVMTGLSPTDYFFDPTTMKPDPYDPEQAKKLLADAGYPRGLDTKFWDVGEGGLLSTVDLAVIGYLRKIGVNADILALNYSAWYTKMMPKQSPEIWPSLWGYRAGGGRSAGFRGWSSRHHSTKSYSKNNTNRRLDEIIDAYPNTKDPAERKRIAVEGVKLTQEEFNFLEFVAVPQYFAVSSKVGGWESGPSGALDAKALSSITHAK